MNKTKTLGIALGTISGIVLSALPLDLYDSVSDVDCSSQGMHY